MFLAEKGKWESLNDGTFVISEMSDKHLMNAYRLLSRNLDRQHYEKPRIVVTTTEAIEKKQELEEELRKRKML